MTGFIALTAIVVAACLLAIGGIVIAMVKG